MPHTSTPTSAPAFAELHCLSNFSFLRGASRASELMARAARLGYAALAITDECSLAGIVRAHEAAKEHGVALICGTELRLADGPKLVLLATDRAGYGNLSALITKARRAAPKGEYRIARADLDDGLPGCLALWIPDFDAADRDTAWTADAAWLRERFPDRAWIAAELHLSGDDLQRVDALDALSAATGLPVVATNDVHMHARGRRALQDVLTAIRIGTTVEDAGYALFPNGERHLRAIEQLATLYPPEWLAASVAIAARCTFSLDELRYEYPEEIAPPGETPTRWLRAMTEAGLAWRFGDGPAPWTLVDAAHAPIANGACAPRPASSAPAPCPANVRALIEHELSLIAELGYEPYFLTVFDIVCFARRAGILCQGRGSAANSAVCYALGITEVDPARMSVLFERFISRERNEPPDIDVDFEHERREEVIQYIYAKYGRDRAALAATVVSYRPKSAYRDVGKALGLDLEQVDRIARNLAWWDDGAVVEDRLREVGFDPASMRMRQLLSLARTLVGFPRHLSQHVGGFVVSRGPLSRLVPIENAAMADRSVIQWDKDDLDALGLLKVDILALGMLTAIRRALAMVAARLGRPFGLHDIPAEDPATYDMLCRADTVGVFQIESRAQMSMLPRLKPRRFYDLVIEVAIVRPGPIQGGMVHPYLRRRRGLEPVTYPSDDVQSVLERTLGVPIFQEQVMQIAMVAAGFTAGEADRLRRSMAAWRRKGGIAQYARPIIDGMVARGYEPAFAEAIFRQILGFGEYGFPESHAASFALLVYASAWLKCHEPAAFCAALLNSQPMGFYGPSQLVQDAQRHGVVVLPVDVVESAWETTVADSAAQDAPCPGTIRLGLHMVRGLSRSGADRLIAARGAAWESFEQLARRAHLDRRDLECLAKADALASVAGHRHAARWTVAGIEQRPPLLVDAAPVETAPDLPEPAEGESHFEDYAALGLSLGRHPLALLRPLLAKRRMRTAAELLVARHGQVVHAAGLVTCRQRPGTASGVIFVTLEDETGQVNVVVWRDVSARQRRVLLGAQLLAVHGVLERDGDVAHLIAGRLEDLSPLLGGLTAASRDFH